jgi:hypothetical protein
VLPKYPKPFVGCSEPNTRRSPCPNGTPRRPPRRRTPKERFQRNHSGGEITRGERHGTWAWHLPQPIAWVQLPLHEFGLLSRGSQVRVLPGALLLNGGDPYTPPSSLRCARSSLLAPLRSRWSLGLARTIDSGRRGMGRSSQERPAASISRCGARALWPAASRMQMYIVFTWRSIPQ